MATSSVARRYARALLDVAVEAGTSDTIADQLEGLGRAVEQNPELAEVFTNPAYDRSARRGVVDALIAEGGADPLLGNLLRLLVDRNRMMALPDIARVFRSLADERAGRVRGLVSSAVPLDPATLEEIRGRLTETTRREVVLDTAIDPSLIGGVTAQVGSLVFDGSLKTQLRELRRALT